MNTDDRPVPSTFVDPAATYQHSPGSGLASYPLSPQVTWTAVTRNGAHMPPPIGSPTVGQPLAPVHDPAASYPGSYREATVLNPVSIPIGGSAQVDETLAHQVSKSILIDQSIASAAPQVSKTLLIDSALPSVPSQVSTTLLIDSAVPSEHSPNTTLLMESVLPPSQPQIGTTLLLESIPPEKR